MHITVCIVSHSQKKHLILCSVFRITVPHCTNQSENKIDIKYLVSVTENIFCS